MAELRYNHAVNRAMADAMAADSTVVLFGEDVAGAGGVYGATRGLRDRFQIWPRDAFRDRARQQREIAREALIARSRQRLGASVAVND